MIRQKTFIAKDYISLRTKIHTWLEKNPGTTITSTDEYARPRKKGSGKERVIVVDYTRIR